MAMSRIRISIIGFLWLFAGGSAFAGDSIRGAAILRSQQCLHCHAIRGEGGKAAPDLGRGIAHQYTPAVPARGMWNHGPSPLGAVEAPGHSRPHPSERG